MAKINDTTTYPNTTPALSDHVPGTDVSNTGNDANGETVTFLISALLALGAPSQAGAPSSTPDYVGQINIDTSAPAAYIATGTASSADWEQVTLGGNTIASLSENTTPDGTEEFITGDDERISVDTVSTFIFAGNESSLFLLEGASAAADVAGDGQIWVKNDTPNTLWFTDDAGTDFQIGTLTGTETLTNKTLTSPDITDPTIEHRNYEDTTAGASAHTLVAADQSSVIEMNNASAQTLTVPTNASVAFPVGTLITVIQMGAGTTTILGATGVTLSGNGGSASAGSCDIQTQYGAATLYKRATDIWVVFGDIDAVA